MTYKKNLSGNYKYYEKPIISIPMPYRKIQPKWATDQELLKILLFEQYNIPESGIILEMLDFFKIVELGSKKYALNNWLEPNGKKSSEKEMHDSMFHHLAQSFTEGKQSKDKDSHLDPLLHLACRALMLYTRRQRGIVHEDDPKTS